MLSWESATGAIAVLTVFLTMVALAAVGLTRWRLAKQDETQRYYKSAIDALTADNQAKELTIARQQGEIETLRTEQKKQAEQIQMLSNMVTAKEEILSLAVAFGKRFDQVDEQLREVRGLVGGTRAGEIGESPRRAPGSAG